MSDYFKPWGEMLRDLKLQEAGAEQLALLVDWTKVCGERPSFNASSAAARCVKAKGHDLDPKSFDDIAHKGTNGLLWARLQ